MKRFILPFTAIVLALTACGGKPDRATADKLLSKACVAGVQALSPTSDVVTFESAAYSSEKSHDGVDLRRVSLKTQYVRNRGTIELRDYTCWFEEQSNLMGYLPKFYRLEKDGEVFGNVDGTIKGEFGALLKLQQSVEDVLEPR